MDTFETLLREHSGAAERFVKFRLPSSDAEDVLQEIYLTACRKFHQLKDSAQFRPWLIAIARSRCTDYYRSRHPERMIPLDALPESVLRVGRCAHSAAVPVRDTLARLSPEHRQILRLFYFEELPQTEIARRLGIPAGTVKSRLHAARENFRALYPYAPREQGGTDMKKNTILPEILPQYTITPSAEAAFPVKWEELIGWMIVPKHGEKLSWGLYDMPARTRTEYTDMEVVGRAEVHGIEGVEITAIQHDAKNYYRTGSVAEMERRFIAQLTDTHCRYLAESHVENGVRKCYTFLDGAPFTDNWGFGEDNCGTEIHLSQKGILRREGSVITGGSQGKTMDIVGRCTVEIAGKAYDTVCLMDVESFDDSIVTEQYLDQNGRTVLWRRFNRDDWAHHRYSKSWTEMLPDNERLTVNGEIYVHWYDCVSDYIFA